MRPRIKIAQGYTTRLPRGKELSFPEWHREYLYVSNEEFDERNNRKEFEWIVELGNGRYATPKTLFEQQSDSILLFLVTPDMVPRIHGLSSGIVRSFFFFPPNPREMTRRMRLRGESWKEIKERLADSKNPLWRDSLKNDTIDWITISTERRKHAEVSNEILHHLGLK